MDAARKLPNPSVAQPRRGSRTLSNRRRAFLLWYWALAIPRDGRVLRVIYLQPILGALIAALGVLAVVLGWPVPIFIVPAIVVLGLALVAFSYPISLVYYSEYPGGFDERLEEYVGRRVSRLSRDEFIPRFKAQSSASAQKIRTLRLHARQAVHVEKVRLEQTERGSDAALCGVLVIGPTHANKTGALWDAMARELKGWTFIRWPHHMDHPINLARRLGHRIVLWIDDLHDFAHPGEAAALAQFVQQMRENKQQFIVLATCRDGEHLQVAERYFRPLMNDLQRVHVADPLPSTPQVEDLQKVYKQVYKTSLTPSQQSVLVTIDWLQSLRIFTYPGEVLRVLYTYFLDPNANTDHEVPWEATIQGLGERSEHFVRVDQRADAQTILSSDRYKLRPWFRYTITRRKFPRPHKVVEPINLQYLDLAQSRAKSAQNITSRLEQQPDLVIEQLAAVPVAAETLVLLGDAYLNHLGESIDNAGQLAITCYEGALRQLDTAKAAEQFPGAWAAALVGKGTAELRVGLPEAAEADFTRVVNSPKPKPDAAGVPVILRARAWHGRGDVIASTIPYDSATHILSNEAIAKLKLAAKYYQNAAETIPHSSPLWSETKLDRANVLYRIAQTAFRRYGQSLAGSPMAEIVDAQQAYREAEQVYAQAVAPAVWAEIQRRQGELCLMETMWFLPANMRLPRQSAATTAMVNNPDASEDKALAAAKKARDYFIAARNLFAPSYLPMSWSQTQTGLVRALLVIARIAVAKERAQASDIFSQCLHITQDTAEKLSMLAQSPLDWVDLQLLTAQAEIGLGSLPDANAASHYPFARGILENIKGFLSSYELLPGKPASERIATQRNVLESLTLAIKQAAPGP